MTTKQENHEEQSPRTFVTAPADWPIGMTLPDAPNVQLYFWGIMGFRPDLAKHECEIGVHFGNPTHSLKVVVMENFQDIIYSSADETPDPALEPNTKFEFEVIGKPADVKFLQSTAPLRRSDPSEDPKDFRWLVDFEHPDFYGFRLPMRERVFRQRIFVRHGMFYTLDRTCAKFDVIGGPNQQSNIFLAKYTAAALVLQTGECLSLKINDREKLPINKVCADSGKTYQFLFVNNCKREGLCRGSDFHLNFDAVAIPHNQKFELVLREPCSTTPVPDPLKVLFQNAFSKRKDLADLIIFQNDEAPCSGSGYGSGGFFPTFPPG